MAGGKLVNDFVRRRLRNLRHAKKIRAKELAIRAGLPYSSYACMEHGFYNISLDNLFRVLGALESAITDVWPPESLASSVADAHLYVQKMQEFRLNEIITLIGAEGGALFVVTKGKARVLLYQNIGDFLLDRLQLCLEDGREYGQGLWFMHSLEDRKFYLFLKAERCPAYVRELTKQYMLLWAGTFSIENYNPKNSG